MDIDARDSQDTNGTAPATDQDVFMNDFDMDLFPTDEIATPIPTTTSSSVAENAQNQDRSLGTSVPRGK